MRTLAPSSPCRATPHAPRDGQAEVRLLRRIASCAPPRSPHHDWFYITVPSIVTYVHSRRDRPDACATGRSSAARIACSVPQTIIDSRARVTAVYISSLVRIRELGSGSITATASTCEPWLLWIVRA